MPEMLKEEGLPQRCWRLFGRGGNWRLHWQRKANWAYGGFLLASYDADNQEYQSICKFGTGFSDEDLQTHAEFFKKHGIVDPEKGIYLSHCVFRDSFGDDKAPEDATSASQVADMYSNQDQIKNQQHKSKDPEEDFY